MLEQILERDTKLASHWLLNTVAHFSAR